MARSRRSAATCKDESDDEVIDGRGKLAIPGLINGHTHLAMTLLRGYADDMELMPWLQEKIWPLEARLTEEDVRWGVKLGCLELIRFGITCYNDMYYFPDDDRPGHQGDGPARLHLRRGLRYEARASRPRWSPSSAAGRATS